MGTGNGCLISNYLRSKDDEIFMLLSAFDSHFCSSNLSF
jgi:hypothetical protein